VTIVDDRLVMVGFGSGVHEIDVEAQRGFDET